MRMDALKTLLLLGVTFAIGGCVSQSMPKMQKAVVQPGATLNVVIDCSIPSVNADLHAGVHYPPDAAINERVCKQAGTELAARLTDGEYSRRFSSVRMVLTTIGLGYVKPKLSEAALNELESDESGPIMQEWWEHHKEYADSAPLLVSKSADGAMYKKIAVDAFQGIQKAGSENPSETNEKIVALAFDATRELGLHNNEFVLFYQVKGRYIKVQESVSDRIIGATADTAFLVASCLLGSCSSTNFGKEEPSYFIGRPLLVDSNGKVRWTGVASSSFDEEENQETEALKNVVDASLPLDLFNSEEASKAVSPDETPGNDAKKEVPVPKLIST